MPIYLSKKGLRKLEDETAALEGRLQQLKKRTQQVTETGGDQWHDNPALYSLMGDLRAANGRLAEIYAFRSQAQVMDYPKNPEQVCMGSTIVLEEDGESRVYHIAGFGESEPDHGVIAYDTPLARSIIGKKIGDDSQLTITGRVKRLHILEIRPYEGP